VLSVLSVARVVRGLLSIGRVYYAAGIGRLSPRFRLPVDRSNVFTLKLLGGASLKGDHGPLTGRVAQRRTLALLAMLAMSRRAGVRREKLAAALWPESDGDRARHLLSDTVYVINRALEGEVVTAVGDELRLRFERLACDARAFEDAAEQGALDAAVRLYAGPFLDGFFVDGSDVFERWSSAERERLHALYRRALERLASSEAERGDEAPPEEVAALVRDMRTERVPRDAPASSVQAPAARRIPSATQARSGRWPRFAIAVAVAALLLAGARVFWPARPRP
jgi:hypothetical protein